MSKNASTMASSSWPSSSVVDEGAGAAAAERVVGWGSLNASPQGLNGSAPTRPEGALKALPPNVLVVTPTGVVGPAATAAWEALAFPMMPERDG